MKRHRLYTVYYRYLYTIFPQNRWKVDDLLDKNQFLPGFNGFGGGRYHCPGRWFALMELQLMVAMTIKMFDMELLNIVPQPVSLL